MGCCENRFRAGSGARSAAAGGGGNVVNWFTLTAAMSSALTRPSAFTSAALW